MERIVRVWCLLATAGCLQLAGCGGNLFQVTRAKPPDPPSKTLQECKDSNDGSCDVPGIPVYAVAYRCLHTTVWLQPVYVVTLTVTSDSKKDGVPVLSKPITITKIFGRREIEGACTAGMPCVQSTLAEIQQSPQAAEYQTITDEFKALPEMDPLLFDTTRILEPSSTESKEVILYSNSVAPERYVDANAVFYYNVGIPKSGTANAEVDLTDEGILSKSSGQVESKTLETVLGLFPVSDLIKAAAGVAAPLVPPSEKPYKLDLQVTSKVYRHTRSAPLTGKRPPCQPDAALVGSGGEPYNFTIDDVTAGPPAQPTDNKQKAKPAKPPA